MSIILSYKKLEDLNTFRDCEPVAVDVLDDQNDLSAFISLKAHTLGYPSVEKFLERNKVYCHRIATSTRLLKIGH